MGSNIDLRKYQNSDSIADIYSKIVSGKPGYKAIIERRKEPTFCADCKKQLKEDAKFCPDCGGKGVQKMTACPKCNKDIEGEERFCMECGNKLS